MPVFRLFALGFLVAAPVRAADWPQWLGPQRDGSTSEKVEPWKGSLQPLWKQPVGEGFSVPVVAGGRVFIHARVKGQEAEELFALDARTGKQLWRLEYPRAAYFSLINNGPQATPAVSLDRVYSFGITGVLSCHEAVTGKRLWLVDVFKELKAELPQFGVTCSPLVVGDRVLVTVGGKSASFAAFDADSGTLAWKSQDLAVSSASPVLFTNRARKGRAALEAIFVSATGLVALNPFDGSLAWDFAFSDQPFGVAPTPIRAGDLLLASSDRTGSVGITLTVEDGQLKATRGWANADLSGYFSTPVVAGEHFYMISTQTLPQPSATLRCVELRTGKEAWKRERVGFFHAGLIRAADNRLLMLNDAGDLTLVQHDPAGFRELAASKGVCGATFVTPSLASGCLYARDRTAVVCLPLAARP